MPGKHATDVDPTSTAKLLIATLGETQVLQVARESRWLRRLRSITPLALVVACLSTLGASKATWIAAILRTFDAFTGLSIRYKPFHNQLLRGLLHDVELVRAVSRAFLFLGENARRAHPKRDRQRGRLCSGLIPLGTRSAVVG